MGAIISTLLFQPPRPPSYSEHDKRITWLECTGKGTRDPTTGKEVPVQIPVVYLSYKGSDLVLLHSHGNATDLGQMMPYLELLRSSLKINVCSYEYQGYGVTRPKVKSTEQRIYDSIEATIDFLINVKGHKRSTIIVFGTSLGSGPSIYVTSKYSQLNRGASSVESNSSKRRASTPASTTTTTSSSSSSPMLSFEQNGNGKASVRRKGSARLSRKKESISNAERDQNMQQSTEDVSVKHNEAADEYDDNYDSFRGLILQSAFTSVIRIKIKQPLKFLDMFNNLEKMNTVDCPVFVIHGKVDEVVPFEHALAFKEKIINPYKPLYIDYAGHNNIMDILSVERYIKKIYEFIIYLNQEEQKREKKRRERQDGSRSITVESVSKKDESPHHREMNSSIDSSVAPMTDF